MSIHDGKPNGIMRRKKWEGWAKTSICCMKTNRRTQNAVIFMKILKLLCYAPFIVNFAQDSIGR